MSCKAGGLTMKNQWLQKIDQYRQLGIVQTKNITPSAWQDLIEAVHHLKSVGWDQPAIRAYCRYAKNAIALKQDANSQGEQQAVVYAMTFLVGSSVYTKMFQASNLRASDKLQLMFNQLQAKCDEFGFLQLAGPFKIDPKLAPVSLFLTILRQTIQKAFPRETLDMYARNNKPQQLDEQNCELAFKVHAFRSYIDRQCIDYIRQNQNGATDYDKLLEYAHERGIGLDYQTGANYHNRYHEVFTFPKNMKVQISQHTKMVEFIVDLTTSAFVSEWNVYRINEDGTIDSNPGHYNVLELEQVANTESFNYGKPQHRSHRLLDIEHPSDPLLRRKATNYWRYEKDYNRGGRYVDIVNVGGHDDFLAWQEIPDDSRLAAYQDYVKECRQLELHRVYGFNRFYLHLNENV